MCMIVMYVTDKQTNKLTIEIAPTDESYDALFIYCEANGLTCGEFDYDEDNEVYFNDKLHIEFAYIDEFSTIYVEK